MAPDGSFTNEFQYRLQQVREMAMKLAAAPFDTGDVLTVYQVRYKPTIHFCLPMRRNPMPILQSNASKTRDQSEHETGCNLWAT